MKRCLALILVLCLLLSCPVFAQDETEDETEAVSAAAAEAEEPQQEEQGEAETEQAEEVPPEEESAGEEEPEGYVPGQFTDVAEDAWYGVEGQGVIRRVWELDLMVGMGDGAFQPEGLLRLSEAVKLAALLHSRAVGDEAEFPPSEPWYQVYVDYCVSEGVLQDGEFGDLTAYALRGEMAHILASALPEEDLPHINAVFAVPDVLSILVEPAEYAGDILRLYRAGVLLGDGGTHVFRPGDNITRAETAAAVVRLAVPEERQRLELLPLTGAAGEIPEALLVKDSGECLTLGYHPWAEFSVFLGEEEALSMAADYYVSLDCDESLGYPVFGEEGSLILAEYGDYALRFLIPDRDPQGVYVFSLEVTGDTLEDGRGIRTGTPLRELTAAFPEQELLREEESPELIWFTCLAGEPEVEYRYAVGWDGRVSRFSQTVAGAERGAV